MEAAVAISLVNLLTGIITRILTEAKGSGADVDALLAKYDDAHIAAMAYTPKEKEGA